MKVNVYTESQELLLEVVSMFTFECNYHLPDKDTDIVSSANQLAFFYIHHSWFAMVLLRLTWMLNKN